MDDGRRKRLAKAGMVLGAMLLLGAMVGWHRNASAATRTHTVRIEASQYRFDPGTIRVNRGDIVTIELLATDVVHGLYLDGYGLQVMADPGQTARLTFVADRTGTFRFRCAVSCGAMHPFMIGKLQVGSRSLFWQSLALALVAAILGFAAAHRDTV